MYVGRKAPGYPASPLGNPFKVNDSDRETVLEQYRAWLKVALEERRAPQVSEIQRLARLVLDGEDVVLLCWCSPKPCHAEIVAEVVVKLARRMGRSF